MSERPDTAALVETVREALEYWHETSIGSEEEYERKEGAVTALTALAERIAELERERAEHERDFKTTCQAWGNDARAADAAEAKLAEAEAALERIAGAPSRTDNEDERLIAARALRSLRGET